MPRNDANDTQVRGATADDLAALVRLLGQLNSPSSAPTPQHEAAFAEIQADPRQRLLVVEHAGAVVATAALIIVPNLGRGGRPYAIVENVVTDEPVRGRGYGSLIMRCVIEQARSAGCYKVARTSRDFRTEAHAFYRRMGFEPSSAGFRYALAPE